MAAHNLLTACVVPLSAHARVSRYACTICVLCVLTWACVVRQVGDMEEAAARFNKQVTKLGRDVKAWPVWSWLKDTIDAFKKTMPLITDLRNPAMRPRHWQQLMEHIGNRSALCMHQVFPSAATPAYRMSVFK